MVYWGSDNRGRNYVLRAESPVDHPNRWVAVGEPMIGPQPNTNHNCGGPGFPFLLPITDDYWLLYFCGWGRRADGRLPNTTGVAISEDRGRTWTYHEENPILPLDRAYNAEGTGSVWVLHEQDRFRMYYTAIGRYFTAPRGVQTGHGSVIPEIGIAYAESCDGIHWKRPLNGLVVRPRGFGVEPYEYICSKPCVLREGRTYTMWVNTFGTAYRVQRLASRDGTNWQWAERIGPNGELGVGEEGSFDDEQRRHRCNQTSPKRGPGKGNRYPTRPLHDYRHYRDSRHRYGSAGRGTTADRILCAEAVGGDPLEHGRYHQRSANIEIRHADSGMVIGGANTTVSGVVWTSGRKLHARAVIREKDLKTTLALASRFSDVLVVK